MSRGSQQIKRFQFNSTFHIPFMFTNISHNVFNHRIRYGTGLYNNKTINRIVFRTIVDQQ